MIDSDNSIVCTLFEGDYHYGAAGLINSLYKNGFRGSIYAGFKKALPFWAIDAKENNTLEWNGAKTLYVQPDLPVHFLPVESDSHLANYKPAFMLELKRFTNKGIFYFDPDIIVKCAWEFFESWIQYGVAVVQEIVSNNFSPCNPKRMQWQPVIERSGRKIERQLHHIINSGFCGVDLKNIEFLRTWNNIIDTAVQYFNYDPGYFIKNAKYTDIFIAGDQDMMNIATMCSQSIISDIGPEGMDFTYGGWLMSHATGNPKPWNKKFFVSALKGYTPTLAQKAYWFQNFKPIKTHNAFYITIKKLSIYIASFIGRFYRRS